MQIRNFVTLMSSVSLIALSSGCTPQARDDVSNAGSDLHAAASDSAKGTKQAIADADKKAEADSKVAVAKTETAVAKTGAEISSDAKTAVQKGEKVAADAGAAVSKDSSAAIGSTEKALAKTDAEAKEGTALLTLTPKVKSAILVDDRVKIPDLDIDTKTATREVVVNGTASSAEMKSDAIGDAKKELAKANPKYTIVDNLKVGKSGVN